MLGLIGHFGTVKREQHTVFSWQSLFLQEGRTLFLLQISKRFQRLNRPFLNPCLFHRFLL